MFQHPARVHLPGALVLACLLLSGRAALAGSQKAKPAKQQPSQEAQQPPGQPQAPQPPAQQTAQSPQAQEPTADKSQQGAPPAQALAKTEEGQDSAPAPVGEERRLIGEYVRAHLWAITRCYEDRLNDRPTLQGKLIARFDIGSDGHVISTTAEGMDDRELVKCVNSAIRNWRFDKPASGGNLRVAYPFVFRAVSAR